MYKYSCVYTNSSRKFCVGHKMNNEARCNVFQMLTEDNVVRIYILYMYKYMLCSRRKDEYSTMTILSRALKGFKCSWPNCNSRARAYKKSNCMS